MVSMVAIEFIQLIKSCQHHMILSFYELVFLALSWYNQVVSIIDYIIMGTSTVFSYCQLSLYVESKNEDFVKRQKLFIGNSWPHRFSA